MISRKLSRCIAMFTAAVAAALAAASAYSQEPTTPLRIRLLTTLSTSAIYVLMDVKKDILPNYGKQYTLETRRIDSSAEVAIVLAGGAADLGGTTTGPMINANTKLNGDLRILADVSQGGVRGYLGVIYAVRADDAIREVKDLKGKTLATMGFGSQPDLAMRVEAKKAGLDLAKDATIVQVPVPAMLANLRERKVDMVQLLPPFYALAKAKGDTRVLFASPDVWGPYQILFLAGRGEFVSKNPRRLQAFFDDYYRLLRYTLDPKNREELVEIHSKMQNIPAASFRAWWNTKDDYYRDPEGIPNVGFIKREMEVMKDNGLIETAVDIDKMVDLSFIRRAAQNYSKR
jgi:NitT/TauT family transport system substrate-binding protein